jgi:excisionase family DNA binding protein
MTHPVGRLVNASAVAAALGVSRETVYRLARLDRLPSVRIGPRSVRFDPAAVAAAVTTSEGSPNP